MDLLMFQKDNNENLSINLSTVTLLLLYLHSSIFPVFYFCLRASPHGDWLQEGGFEVMFICVHNDNHPVLLEKQDQLPYAV